MKMPKLEFGCGKRGVITGADIYVKVFQISSLLVAAYIVIALNYPPVMMKNGAVNFLADLGIVTLPRWEAVLVSLLYEKTLSEVAVFFVLSGAALAFGIAAGRLLRSPGKTAVTARKVFAVIIFCDYILRLMPFGFNSVYGFGMKTAGSAIRLFCAILIVFDIRAASSAS